MTLQALLVQLSAAGVRLRTSGGELVVSGGEEPLLAALVDALHLHRATLLGMIAEDGEWWSPSEQEMSPSMETIEPDATRIPAALAVDAANVQDIYPRALLQEGMLFQQLLEPGSGVDVVQVVCTLPCAVDSDALREASQQVTDRHDVLRTSLHWEDLAAPAQLVRRRVELPFRIEDWRGIGIERRAARMEDFLRRDRQLGFCLEEAPLLRVTLIQLSDDSHELVWTFHHAILDGRALLIVLREVFAIYEALLNGHPSALEERPAYREFIAWLRTLDAASAEAFWREQLRGFRAPTPLPLAALRADEAVLEMRQGDAEQRLSPALTDALVTLARTVGVTMNTIVQGAWAVLLARYSGEEDVVFGATRACRSATVPDAESIVGLFINTLPVRVCVDPCTDLETWLRNLRAAWVAVRPYEHTSLARAQACAEVPAGSPLFETIVVFEHENTDTVLRRLGGAWAHRRIRIYQRANVPLLLSVYGGDELILQLDYDRARVGYATAMRVLRHLATVLEGMAAGGARQHIGDLRWLPEAERRQVVEGWNATDVAYPAEGCVPELVEAQVARTPDAVAVVYEGEQLTYAELNTRANQLAHYLQTLGVGPEVRVALCLERSLELVVSVLAVLKAGGAYVPLDPAYPAERLRYMLADSDPVAVLMKGGLVGLPAGFAEVLAHGQAGCERLVVDLGPDAALWAMASTSNPRRVGLTPEHLAYVLYTSGSTGQPKGVALAHRQAINFVRWARQEFAPAVLAQTLFATSLNFDLAVFECFAPLSVGGVVHVVRDALALAGLGADAGITLVNTVPSALAVLLATEGVPRSVRVVNLAGEPLARELVEQLFATTAVETVCNLYGPTEATTYATWVAMSRGTGFVPSIGRPVSNTRVYVLDGQGEPVPVGVAGELYIGGVQVARGYLNRPELTAERFVPDPFSNKLGARLYRTGDLGRWLADGTIEFLGRDDHQVKVRGYRIELGEIEAMLATHPGVQRVVAVAREDAPGEKRLVTYYVASAAGRADACAANAELDAEELRSYLSERLPAYMVPAAYVRLESLPLTPSGKLDRKALPTLDDTAYATEAYAPPEGEIETALAAIWAEVLHVERVGRHDSFFALGGHSLLALRVVARIRNLLRPTPSVGDLFLRPVLADFARGLEQAVNADLSAIEPVPRSSRLAVSFSQERLWILNQLDGASAAYHIPWRVQLTGSLDTVALRQALDRIVARHEVLRTTFPSTDGEPVQRIAPIEASDFNLVECDLRGHPGSDAALQTIILEETTAPFELEKGPLIRGRLIRLAKAEYVLMITMHHIVSDGWSMGLLTNELSTLYTAFVRGERDPLPPLPVQYADYAAWQRQWVSGAVLEEQVAYWKQALAGAPEVLKLPTDHPRPTERDYVGAAVPFSLETEITAALKVLSRRHGATLFQTLLAGWAVVLGRLSGQEDLMIGAPTANRVRTDVEELIGFFVNTLALRVDLAGTPTVAELLAQVKAVALGAQANQDVPFERVLEVVRPARPLGRNPLFPVPLVWQDAPESRLKLPELTATPLPSSPCVAAKYDLTLTLHEVNGRIVGRFEYATALFKRATIERHRKYLQTLLAAMAFDEHRTVDCLPLLPVAERQYDERRAREAEADKAKSPTTFIRFEESSVEQSIYDRFRSQTAAHPRRLAVHSQSHEWTYEELDAQAQRVARAVAMSLGSGAEHVALLLDHDAPMIASMLGVLAAGKAFVPLDPSWPDARMQDVLSDALIGVIVTDDANLTAAQRLVSGQRVLIQVNALGEPSTDVPMRASSVAPGSIAYMIYTSGSTGHPKGVVQSHRNVLAHIRAYTNRLRIGCDDRLVLLASYATDAAVMDVFGALLNGASLHPFSVRAVSVDHLGAWLRDRAISIYHSTPTLYRQMLERGINGAVMSSVRLVVLGGEEVVRCDFEQFKRYFAPGCLFVNGLGPTESTLALHCVMDHDTELRFESVPVGYAVDGTDVLILNDAAEPVELYARGEIAIRSPYLALGYWRRPTLTARAFVPDPGGSGRLYRTGDLGRLLPDGRTEFMGRRDDQVKIRGYRVEPSEVEAALKRLSDVREAMVAKRVNESGEASLVAYVVPEGERPPSHRELRRSLREQLPDYMLPSAVVFLRALPLTSSGKLDRRTLPTLELHPQALDTLYVPPRMPLEAVLAEIWSDLLGLGRVGVEDDFFELGGHSLLAMRVVTRVRQLLQLELPLRSLFESPTIAGLSGRIIAQQAVRVEADRLNNLLLEIEHLSESTVESLLIVDDGPRAEERTHD
ncbi:MAG: amino acid adenylation domain-containing protein [Gemmatimonadaceae bacterium]